MSGVGGRKGFMEEAMRRVCGVSQGKQGGDIGIREGGLCEFTTASNSKMHAGSREERFQKEKCPIDPATWRSLLTLRVISV